jgi:hypothetical protein
VAVTAASVMALGLDVHLAYLREVLPRSLTGEIQDPYSPLWGSFASLLRRLFQPEPDLNPRPALDAPALAAPLARGAAAFVVLLALFARATGDDAAALRRRWATITVAALLASPLTQSYHFLLLTLPVALLLSGSPPRGRELALLALLAFATSPLPHYFTPLASGWSNLLSYPRLLALSALLVLALRGALPPARAAACALLALGVAMTAPAPAQDPGWQRITAARGYLAAEPVACEGGVAWVGIDVDRYVLRHSDGRLLRADGDLTSPRCVDGRLEPRPLEDDGDRDGRGGVAIEQGSLVASGGRLIARPPEGGRFRRPRLSPDGRLVAVQSWEDGSWDIRVVERDTGTSRRVTSQPSNEVEPSWSPDGGSILFASDRLRGLGSTALYRLELR